MDKKTLSLVVKEIESRRKVEKNWRIIVFHLIAADLSAIARGQSSKARKIALGVTLPNTMVVFERGEGTAINLAGKSKG